VALLDRDERHHPWAVRRLRTLPLPWVTCEAVLTESWHLLRARPDIQDRVLDCVADGVLTVSFSLHGELNAIRVLRGRFRDVPMSLADACLVRLSELLPHASVLTLDSDFHVYRRNGSEPIPLIHPGD
jgi:predicted nucleic acid-binding protein